MSEVNPTPNHWAVLIGVNFYVDSPLKGCVRDVENIKQFLTDGSTPVDIVTFTATTPLDSRSSRPVEEPQSWPTINNVDSSLANIIAKAKPGDFVYIHYSGHGTYPEDNGADGLALVLFDDGIRGRYFHGSELAARLSEMVKNGLLVTVVLDCCFSGRVKRRDELNYTGIRAIDHDVPRDTHLSSLPKWLVEPTGYMLFTACGPNEIAEELIFRSNDTRSGALSHFLLEALISLRKTGSEITNQSLHQHLRLKFHTSWPKQNPMRYGNRNISFFGKLRSPDTAFISVFRNIEKKCFCLGAGHALGVYENDEYAIYPRDVSEDDFNDTTKATSKVRVDAVRTLESDLVEIGPTRITQSVKIGWKARPLTHFSPRKVVVRLMASVDNPSQWIEAAKDKRYLQIATEEVKGQPCLFHVKRSQHNAYEILDVSSRKLTSLPMIPIDRTRALDYATKFLEHLAIFNYVEGIENRIPSPFETSFSIRLNDGIRDDIEPGCVDVSHEAKIRLTVRNANDKPLYLYIIWLGPLWQIDDLICNDGGGDYKVLLPMQAERYNLQMTVPRLLRDRGQYQCEDVIKVFVTSKPTSFAPLCLPKIPLSIDDVDDFMRDNNQLAEFLSDLATRRDGESSISDCQWTTRKFVLHTFMA